MNLSNFLITFVMLRQIDIFNVILCFKNLPLLHKLTISYWIGKKSTNYYFDSFLVRSVMVIFTIPSSVHIEQMEKWHC